ncbi:MAG TPA: YdeI/OmpD-associated family protein [Pyrinomonadaceae bacterium]|nr:YdeI/OmpD-associated family protein [Pyrinomonadaceae bacterium]
MKKFKAKIFKIGINPVVDPPDRVLESIFSGAGKDKGPIAVRGRLNGAEFIQTLVKYQGAWRLYINGPMLNDSGLIVGDIAVIEIEFDPRPRDVPMVKEFAAALKRDKKAKAEFDLLSPSRRKEILRYLGSLKSEEALSRNIVRILKHLRNEPTDAQHTLMRKPLPKNRKLKSENEKRP